MPQQISASVGNAGRNLKPDSEIVQRLLNNVPSHQGGPDQPLVVDGLPWQNTQAAIRKFQRIQVGYQSPDGRVDPGHATIAKLNTFEPTPGQAVEVGPVFCF